VRLFQCGDVITGRGIDQVLANPADPVLHESYVQSAIDYVGLVEEANGSIPHLQSATAGRKSTLRSIRRLWGVIHVAAAHPRLNSRRVSCVP